MTYVAWAVLYEGDTDAAYFDILIPRLMEELVTSSRKSSTIPLAPAIRFRRSSLENIAEEAYRTKDAFHLIFIHADTGGRALEQGMYHRGEAYCAAIRARCAWPNDRCIIIAPRHETEAWILADPDAVINTLGYTGSPASLGLPQNGAAAERLSDPKAILQSAVTQVRKRRRAFEAAQIYPAIAQRQRFSELRNANSFRNFENYVRIALQTLGL